MSTQLGQTRPVTQLTFNGEIKNQFDSISEASESTKINRSGIAKACGDTDKRKAAGGYRFVYTDKLITKSQRTFNPATDIRLLKFKQLDRAINNEILRQHPKSDCTIWVPIYQYFLHQLIKARENETYVKRINHDKFTKICGIDNKDTTAIINFFIDQEIVIVVSERVLPKYRKTVSGGLKQTKRGASREFALHDRTKDWFVTEEFFGPTDAGAIVKNIQAYLKANAPIDEEIITQKEEAPVKQLIAPPQEIDPIEELLVRIVTETMEANISSVLKRIDFGLDLYNRLTVTSDIVPFTKEKEVTDDLRTRLRELELEAA